MRYLISGSSSYLGSSFVRSKPTSEFFEVVNEYKKNKNTDLGENNITKISLQELISSECNFDIIIHFAASTKIDNNSWYDLGKDLIDYSIKNSIPIILLGTWWQFKQKYKENEYTKLKTLEQEYLIEKKKKENNFAICFLGDIYGPADSREKFINQVITSLKCNKPFELKNPLGILNPIYIDDMVSRIDLVVKYLSSGLIYQGKVSLLNADWYSSLEVFQIIQRCYQQKFEKNEFHRDSKKIVEDFDKEFFVLKKIDYPEKTFEASIIELLKYQG